MNASSSLTTLTRLGFAARGLVYIVIAWLVIRSGRAEDPSGALQHLAEGGGELPMVLIAVGLIAYGLWRLADALFNVERHSSDGKGLRERLGAGGSAVAHLLLAWQSIRIAEGDSAASTEGVGGGGAEALTLLGPDELVLPAAGLVLLGVAVHQLIKATRCGFLRDLEPQMASREWVKWTGRLGYGARGVVFLISGFFLLKAGLDHREGGQDAGIEAALAWLDNPWDLLVALGLLAFGLYCLIEARFRIIHDVPVSAIAHGDIKPKLH